MQNPITIQITNSFQVRNEQDDILAQFNANDTYQAWRYDDTDNYYIKDQNTHKDVLVANVCWHGRLHLREGYRVVG